MSQHSSRQYGCRNITHEHKRVFTRTMDMSTSSGDNALCLQILMLPRRKHLNSAYIDLHYIMHHEIIG